MSEPAAQDPRLAELAALVSEIRERVKARHAPRTGGAADVPLADLMPLFHARDAAQAKVASIGQVNPRPGGAVNGVIQAVKRAVARGLQWFVRDQIDFNRETVRALSAALDALDQSNRALREFALLFGEYRVRMDEALRTATDTAAAWNAWRPGWENKLAVNEAQFLRGLADIQSAFQHRATLMESNFREMLAQQHKDFEALNRRSVEEVHRLFWKDLDRVRTEYQALIHDELRTVRQRAAIVAPVSGGRDAGYVSPEIDWFRFADKFRGPEEYVREGQRLYVPYFKQGPVLDVGCGRGEFLELMREAGVEARGVDSSAECVAQCRTKGLEAGQADLFEYLTAQLPGSLGGIFAAQVLEHLEPAAVVRFIRLAHSRLRRGGTLAVETPNPECLAIFATHFYIDPTHTRPIPPALMAFYFEEHGFGNIELRRLTPAADSMPSLGELPASVREQFFGALDYCCIGIRL